MTYYSETAQCPACEEEGRDALLDVEEDVSVGVTGPNITIETSHGKYWKCNECASVFEYDEGLVGCQY